jgi:hypothetical protein
MGDASRVVVAQNARIYLAPLGTAAPATATGVLAAGWKEVGLFTPDSLKWKTDPQFQEVRSHQSNYATRRMQTNDGATVDVDLQEWSADNFYAVYGGGNFTTSSGSYVFSPPGVGNRVDVAAIIEIIDGGKAFRRIIPRTSQVEGVEQSFTRANESTLPLRLSVIGTDALDAYYDLTNDPAFTSTSAPSASAVYPATSLWPSITSWPQG